MFLPYKFFSSLSNIHSNVGGSVVCYQDTGVTGSLCPQNCCRCMKMLSYSFSPLVVSTESSPPVGLIFKISFFYSKALFAYVSLLPFGIKLFRTNVFSMCSGRKLAATAFVTTVEVASSHSCHQPCKPGTS